MTHRFPSPTGIARGVRTFESVHVTGDGVWIFDWNFSASDPAFDGHFPEQPILPGVFLVEMAQRATEYALSNIWNTPFRICRIDRFRFLHGLFPGNKCRLEIALGNADSSSQSVIVKVRFSSHGMQLAFGCLVANQVDGMRQSCQSEMECRRHEHSFDDTVKSILSDPGLVLRTLPQRFPMLLIDRFGDNQEDDHAVAYKNISLTDLCYRDVRSDGTSPDFAYPLSLLVESFGQGAGPMLAKHGISGTGMHTIVFGEFIGIDILGDALPGQQLRHDVLLKQVNRQMAVLSGETFVGMHPILRFESVKAFCVENVSVTEGEVTS